MSPHSIGSFPVEEVPAGPFGTSSLILAIASLVSGFMGFYLPLVGLILGIIAIPLGVIAIHRREKNGITGIAVAVVGIMLNMIWIIWVGSFLFGLGG